MHPFMPFITEELWQKVAPILNRSGDTIMLQPYPDPEEFDKDDISVSKTEWIKKFILEVRRIRAERDIPPRKSLTIYYKDGTDEERDWLNKYSNQITKLGYINSSINLIEKVPVDTAVGIAGSMSIIADLADIIDHEAELDKLGKQLDKLKSTKTALVKKLDNQDFIKRAPAEVVNKEKTKLEETQSTIVKLEEQFNRIKSK